MGHHHRPFRAAAGSRIGLGSFRMRSSARITREARYTVDAGVARLHASGAAADAVDVIVAEFDAHATSAIKL